MPRDRAIVAAAGDHGHAARREPFRQNAGAAGIGDFEGLLVVMATDQGMNVVLIEPVEGGEESELVIGGRDAGAALVDDFERLGEFPVRGGVVAHGGVGFRQSSVGFP